MFKFIQRLFAPKPAPRRPMAIRRKRINPVYLLEPKHQEGVSGSISSSMTEVRRGNDVGGA